MPERSVTVLVFDQTDASPTADAGVVSGDTASSSDTRVD
jgi:hypothetical protein